MPISHAVMRSKMAVVLVLALLSEAVAAKKKKNRRTIDVGIQTEPVRLQLQIESLLAAEQAFDETVGSIASSATCCAIASTACVLFECQRHRVDSFVLFVHQRNHVDSLVRFER